MNDAAINPQHYIKECFNRLASFIKAQFKEVSRKNTPWICLLGANRGGKSSLLQHAQCGFKSPTQMATDKVLSTQILDWWANSDAIVLDTSGKSFCNPEQASISQKNWRQLLKQCKKQHGHRPFDHLIFTIDCLTLCQDLIDERFVKNFVQQMQTLKQYYTHCPITIMVTQIDHIDGFNEFFADLNADDRNQGFGFKTKFDTKQNLGEQINQYFDEFTEKLNKQTLPRMHREQNLQKRERIQSFPTQMDHVCKLLRNFILQIPIDIDTHIQGIYFCSSESSGPIVNFTDSSIASQFHLQQPKISGNSPVYKSFFIHNVIQDIINNSMCYTHQPRHQLLRWVTIPITVLLVLGLTVVWHHAYETNLSLVRLTSEELSQKDPNLPASMRWLSELNNMQHILSSYRNYHLRYYRWLGFPQTARLYSNTQQAYQQMLSRFFQDYVNQMLTERIKNNNDNQFKLYTALKIYLMLIEPKHYDEATVLHWFTSQWQQHYADKPQLVKQLQAHLLELLNAPGIHWQYDPKIIADAQAQLQKLPLADIAFLELQGRFKPINNPILPGVNQMPGLNLTGLTISSFYSADHFKDIYLNQIPDVILHMTQKSWVLGRKDTDSMNKIELKALTTQLRQIYIQHYTSQWLKVMKTIKFTLPQNLADLQDLMKQISSKKSALNQLLGIIIGNATLAEQTSNMPSTNNKDFNAIQDLVQQRGSFQVMQHALDALTHYLNDIVSAPDQDKASYNLAIKRLQQQGKNDAISQLLTLANQSPQPIQDWLNTIAQGAWQVILNQSRSYLNTIWATTVLPEYTSHIAKRYPIDSSSQDDITLQDFTHFFGPGGTIDVFFNYYLKPFVNLQKNYWTWVTLQGANIGIPQQTLNMFIRASLIQQMFFTDNQKQASFKFSLSPLSLSDSVNSFTLNLEGQIIQFTHHNHYNSQFSWPGNDPGTVTIHFAAKDNQNPTLTTNGVWAWFRLLDQSQLQTGNDPTQFTADFSLNHYHAKFKISANNKVNPYLPNIINKFTCPDSL